MTILPQQTFAIIKSGAVARGSALRIVQRIEQAGLRVACMRFAHLTKEQAAEFYKEHQGREYFDRLVDSVTGPKGTVLLLIEGGDSIARWRSMMGATDPAKAAPGTLRWDFAGAHGIGLPDNCVHGSDSVESAHREIGMFFPDMLRAAAPAVSTATMVRLNEQAELEVA